MKPLVLGACLDSPYLNYPQHCESPEAWAELRGQCQVDRQAWWGREGPLLKHHLRCTNTHALSEGTSCTLQGQGLPPAAGSSAAMQKAGSGSAWPQEARVGPQQRVAWKIDDVTPALSSRNFSWLCGRGFLALRPLLTLLPVLKYPASPCLAVLQGLSFSRKLGTPLPAHPRHGCPRSARHCGHHTLSCTFSCCSAFWRTFQR